MFRDVLDSELTFWTFVFIAMLGKTQRYNYRIPQEFEPWTPCTLQVGIFLYRQTRCHLHTHVGYYAIRDAATNLERHGRPEGIPRQGCKGWPRRGELFKFKALCTSIKRYFCSFLPWKQKYSKSNRRHGCASPTPIVRHGGQLKNFSKAWRATQKFLEGMAGNSKNFRRHGGPPCLMYAGYIPADVK